MDFDMIGWKERGGWARRTLKLALVRSCRVFSLPLALQPSSMEARRNRLKKHTKTKTGCLVCRKRRIKCDERRPHCRNCSIGNRPCVYGQTQHDGTMLHSPPDPGSSVPDGDSRSLGHRGNGDGFQAIHMSLLYHAMTRMCDFMALEGDLHILIKVALDNSTTAPYVLDQLLALAALHRSTEDPQNASSLLRLSTDLQNRAMRAFNERVESIPEHTAIPSFLFTSLLGMHVMHTILAEHRHSVSDFISAFVEYTRIHRGVRAVTNGHWDKILQSDLKPLLSIVPFSDVVEHPRKGRETADLRELFESPAVQAPSNVKTCLEALDYVQWMFDLKARTSSKPQLGVHATIAWSLVVSNEFITSLEQHRPEALAVLSLFAASLHQDRDFWLFGNAGAGLFGLITAHIGPFWVKGLSWPEQIVNGSAVAASS